MRSDVMKLFQASKLAQLSTEEVDQLRQDLSDQLKLRSAPEAVQVVPDEDVQKELQGIATGEGVLGTAQKRQGLLQAAKGGLLGAGAGAAAGGLASGLPGAGVGLLSGGVPGAVRGYQQGKEKVRDEQFRGLLAEKYQDSPKVASSLDMLLEHLFPRSAEQKPPIESTRSPKFERPVPTFLERQGKTTVRGKQRQIGSGLLSKAPVKTPAPRAMKPKSLVIAGGLAALSALGLTAAQLQKYRKAQGRN